MSEEATTEHRLYNQRDQLPESLVSLSKITDYCRGTASALTPNASGASDGDEERVEWSDRRQRPRLLRAQRAQLRRSSYGEAAKTEVNK